MTEQLKKAYGDDYRLDEYGEFNLDKTNESKSNKEAGPITKRIKG